MSFNMRVTINYPEDEKEYDVTPESEKASSPGDAIDKIILREKTATSFVFVIVASAMRPAQPTHAQSPVDDRAERA